MDPAGQGHGVIVFRADDDTRVRMCPRVKPDKVPPIQRKHCSTLTGAECEHPVVWDLLVRLARLATREHVMTQLAQFLDDWPRKILVGVESGHWRQASWFLRMASSISSRFRW